MMSLFVGELIGTCILILLGNGVVANALLHKSKGEKGGWIVITAGWAFAVAIAVYCVGWISGAHINPAVTLGFALVGKTPWSQLFTYWSAQLLGAMLGQCLVWISYYDHWKATVDPTLKLLCFSTHPAIRHPIFNFITEVIATAVLLFGILGILNANNGVNPSLAGYLIGILIFAIGLSLGGPTGFAINPARDLGPRLMHQWLPLAGKGSSEWGYAWVPIVGPLLGGSLGAYLYSFLF